MTRSMTLPDFLTDEQIEQARKIYVACQNSDKMPASEIAKQVIEPNMAEINRKLGQENDAHYLAFCCEYVFSQVNHDEIAKSSSHRRN